MPNGMIAKISHYMVKDRTSGDFHSSKRRIRIKNKKEENNKHFRKRAGCVSSFSHLVPAIASIDLNLQSRTAKEINNTYFIGTAWDGRTHIKRN